jgi:hypothetical protein
VDRSKKSESMVPRLLIISAVVAASLIPLPAISKAASTARFQSLIKSRMFAQDDDSIPDEDAVPTEQVDKYIAVYSAMQKNHGLSVEQAASKQGLTVDEFRTLEDKIERNPVVHERVLDALKSSAGAKAADKPK